MTVENLFDDPEAATDLIALLADEGVAHFFINPGTDSAPIQEALAAARAAGTRARGRCCASTRASRWRRPSAITWPGADPRRSWCTSTPGR